MGFRGGGTISIAPPFGMLTTVTTSVLALRVIIEERLSVERD